MKWSGTDRPVLVIGYGNSLRRDDGAGLLLSEGLVDAWQTHDLPVSLMTAHQLSPELADDIVRSGADIVVFADATDASGSPDAAIETARIPLLAGAIGASPSLGHHLTPAAVMLYARELFGFAGVGWIVAIPGYDFDHGEGVSARTRALVDDYVAHATDTWLLIQDKAAPSTSS